MWVALSITKKLLLFIASVYFWVFAFLFATGPGQVLVFVLGWLAVILTMFGLDLPLMNEESYGIVMDVQRWFEFTGPELMLIFDTLLFDGFAMWVFIVAILFNIRWFIVPLPSLPLEELVINLLYLIVMLMWLPMFLYLIHIPIAMIVSVILADEATSFIIAGWVLLIGVPLVWKLPIFGFDRDNFIIFLGWKCFVFLLKLPSRILFMFPRSQVGYY